MKINKELIDFFSNILGSYRKHSKGNFSFKCPWKDHKHSRLWVNFKTGNFQCWACENLKGQSFYQLLKKVKGSKYQFERLNKILDNKYSVNYIKVKNDNKDKKQIKLPKSFHPLVKKQNNIEYKNALRYIINKRDISFDLIRKYNIGYCKNGKFKQRIIIPSYNNNGKLNYFIARSYYKSKQKYKNPTINNNNIIPFESYISWDIPPILVEGVFDAISVDYNTIPILGKSIPNKLLKKLIEKEVNYIYLLLDADVKSNLFDIVNNLLESSISVKLVNLPEGKDPGNMKRDKLLKLCRESEEIDYKKLLELKMMS